MTETVKATERRIDFNVNSLMWYLWKNCKDDLKKFGLGDFDAPNSDYNWSDEKDDYWVGSFCANERVWTLEFVDFIIMGLLRNSGYSEPHYSWGATNGGSLWRILQHMVSELHPLWVVEDSESSTYEKVDFENLRIPKYIELIVSLVEMADRTPELFRTLSELSEYRVP